MLQITYIFCITDALQIYNIPTGPLGPWKEKDKEDMEVVMRERK